MKREEADVICKLGAHAPAHLMREAKRVIQLTEALSRSQRREADVSGLTQVQRDRINSILAYRLALACGKLNDWRKAA